MRKLLLKFGFRAMLRNAVRFAVGLLLAAVSFAMAGISIFGESYDFTAWEKELLMNGKQEYHYMALGYSLDSGISGISTFLWNKNLDYEVFQTIDDGLRGVGAEYAVLCGTRGLSSAPETVFAPYRLADYIGSGEEEPNLFVEHEGKELFAPTMGAAKKDDGVLGANEMSFHAENIYLDFFRKLTIFSSEAMIADFGYTLYGKYPEAIDEVALPQSIYNSFLHYGYRTPETGEIVEIRSPEDLFGKTILLGTPRDGVKTLRIVGVVGMDYEAEHLKEGLDYNKDGEYRSSWWLTATPLVGVVISRAALDAYQPREEGYYEGYVGGFTIAKESSHFEAVVDFVLSQKPGSATEYYDSRYFSNRGMGRFRIQYFVPVFSVSLLPGACFQIYYGYIRIFNRFIPILCVFSVVLFGYGIASMLYRRQRQVGLLQALGASKREIGVSMAIPLLCYAMAVIALSLLLQGIYLGVLNHALFAEAAEEISYYRPGYFLTAADGPYNLLQGFVPYTMTAASVLFTVLVPLATIGILLPSILALFCRNGIVANLRGRQRNKKSQAAGGNAPRGVLRLFAVREVDSAPKAMHPAEASVKQSKPPKHMKQSRHETGKRRGGLRVGSIFKIGLHGLFGSLWRLGVTVFLAAVALGFFGMSFSAASFDEADARERAVFLGEPIVSASPYFDAESFRRLETELDATPARYGSGELAAKDWSFFWGNLTPWTDALNATVAVPQGLLCADEAFLRSYGMKLQGRLPAREDEVAISTCQLNAFLTFGYYDHLASPAKVVDGELVLDPAYLHAVESAEALLAGEYRVKLAYPDGTEFAARIVGVVDYGTCAHTHESRTPVPDRYDKLFVSESYLTEYCKQLHRGDYVADYALPAKLSSAGAEHALYAFVEGDAAYSFYSSELSRLESAVGQLKSYRTLFTYLALGFTAFSVMLIWHFISYSMEKKKSEIAILRALGATKRDVGLTFVAESVLLAALQGILGIAVSALLAGIFNADLGSNLGLTVSFVVVSPLCAAVVLAVSFVVSVLSAIVPILRTANRSPVEAIRENQE